MRIAAWRAHHHGHPRPRDSRAARGLRPVTPTAPPFAPTTPLSLQSAPETPLRVKRLGDLWHTWRASTGLIRHAPATQPGGSPIAEPAAHQDSRLDEGRTELHRRQDALRPRRPHRRALGPRQPHRRRPDRHADPVPAGLRTPGQDPRDGMGWSGAVDRYKGQPPIGLRAGQPCRVRDWPASY